MCHRTLSVIFIIVIVFAGHAQTVTYPQFKEGSSKFHTFTPQGFLQRANGGFLVVGKSGDGPYTFHVAVLDTNFTPLRELSYPNLLDTTLSTAALYGNWEIEEIDRGMCHITFDTVQYTLGVLGDIEEVLIVEREIPGPVNSKIMPYEGGTYELYHNELRADSLFNDSGEYLYTEREVEVILIDRNSAGHTINHIVLDTLFGGYYGIQTRYVQVDQLREYPGAYIVTKTVNYIPGGRRALFQQIYYEDNTRSAYETLSSYVGYFDVQISPQGELILLLQTRAHNTTDRYGRYYQISEGWEMKRYSYGVSGVPTPVAVGDRIEKESVTMRNRGVLLVFSLPNENNVLRRVNLYDVRGRHVKSGSGYGADLTIDTKGLAHGIYTYRISGAQIQKSGAVRIEE